MCKGDPVSQQRIYMSAPDVGEAEKAAILRALDSGWIAPLGPEVDAFEEEVADYCDRKHAVALSSGTAALNLGLFPLGVEPGNLVVLWPGLLPRRALGQCRQRLSVRENEGSSIAQGSAGLSVRFGTGQVCWSTRGRS